MLYQRGKERTWWYRFRFGGRIVHESARTQSKTIAREAEKQRRRHLEESWNRITRRTLPPTFEKASQDWLTIKRPQLAPRSLRIEQANLAHLLPVLRSRLISDIDALDIARYQQARLEEGASPKTVNLEVGTFRAIMRRAHLWDNGRVDPQTGLVSSLRMDVKMLPTRDDIGQAISREQEAKLLEECGRSRSRSLYPAVVLALSTTMRYSEIRLLKWKQLDFMGRRVWVGKSKTKYGEGRPIKMNDRAFQVMTMWAGAFPHRQPEHYVFPTEKCGAAGDDFKPCVYGTDPTKPIGDWKEAWEAARERAGLTCRFHDLRHTACTRMLEAGKPFSVVATIMGWSPSTTVRMSRRYAHIGEAAQQEAVKALESDCGKIPDFRGDVHQIGNQVSAQKNAVELTQ